MWMVEQGCGATIEAVWNRDIEAMACNRVIKKNSNLWGSSFEVEQDKFWECEKGIEEEKKTSL